MASVPSTLGRKKQNFLGEDAQKNKLTYRQKIGRDLVKNKYIYLMAIPVLLYYLIFHYGPMYGAIIAFKDFSPAKGILESPWAGLKHFKEFFGSFYFVRILKNTLLINIYNLVFGFPAPIILAILLNELRNKLFKRAVQTVTYLPHFISIMVLCGLIIDFSGRNGLVNDIIAFFGGERTNLLMMPELFQPIFVGTNIWQELGWNSIIYLAALSAVDPQIYEASTIDGAGRLRKIWNISLPSMLPTIVVLLILRMGSMMNIGFEKIILLYTPTTYETADVISSFVYRKGLQNFNFSASAAVGLFNSVINFTLLISTNWISRKVNETSLW